MQDFDAAKLLQFFDQIESNEQSMGSLSIYRNGQEVFQRPIGFEDREAGIKASYLTRYRVGSITKSVMATIIMQMVEEGRLELHSLLSKWFPMLENADAITIKHLLQHRSGLFNFTDDDAFDSYSEMPQSQADLLAKFTANANVFPPGKQMQYSNTGYVLLSMIAEAIDGKLFNTLLQHRIAEPHNLTHTYHGGVIGAKANEAHSYRIKNNWSRASESDMSVPMGAGGIVSTAADINTFYHALFAGKIVKPTSVNLMTAMKDDYGFGLTEYKLDARHAFGHDGSIDGFNSIAAHFPEENTTFCYLSNGTVWGADNVGEGAAKIFYGHDYDIPDFKRMALPIAIRQFSDDPKLLERVKRVLNEGADIDAQSPEGDTALILVGWLTTNLPVVHYLIEQGADVNIANENGDTALIDAAYLGKNNILKILLDNGAEIEAKNKRGQSALFMARETGNDEAVDLLREAVR